MSSIEIQSLALRLQNLEESLMDVVVEAALKISYLMDSKLMVLVESGSENGRDRRRRLLGDSTLSKAFMNGELSPSSIEGPASESEKNSKNPDITEKPPRPQTVTIEPTSFTKPAVKLEPPKKRGRPPNKALSPTHASISPPVTKRKRNSTDEMAKPISPPKLMKKEMDNEETNQQNEESEDPLDFEIMVDENWEGDNDQDGVGSSEMNGENADGEGSGERTFDGFGAVEASLNASEMSLFFGGADFSLDGPIDLWEGANGPIAMEDHDHPMVDIILAQNPLEHKFYLKDGFDLNPRIVSLDMQAFFNENTKARTIAALDSEALGRIAEKQSLEHAWLSSMLWDVAKYFTANCKDPRMDGRFYSTGSEFLLDIISMGLPGLGFASRMQKKIVGQRPLMSWLKSKLYCNIRSCVQRKIKWSKNAKAMKVLWHEKGRRISLPKLNTYDTNLESSLPFSLVNNVSKALPLPSPDSFNKSAHENHKTPDTKSEEKFETLSLEREFTIEGFN